MNYPKAFEKYWSRKTADWRDDIPEHELIMMKRENFDSWQSGRRHQRKVCAGKVAELEREVATLKAERELARQMIESEG